MGMRKLQTSRRINGERIYTFMVRFSKVAYDISNSGYGGEIRIHFLLALQPIEPEGSGSIETLSASSHNVGRYCPEMLRNVTQILLDKPLSRKMCSYEGQMQQLAGKGGDNEDTFVAKNKVNRTGHDAAAVKGAQRQMNNPSQENRNKKTANPPCFPDSDQSSIWVAIAISHGRRIWRLTQGDYFLLGRRAVLNRVKPKGSSTYTEDGEIGDAMLQKIWVSDPT